MGPKICRRIFLIVCLVFVFIGGTAVHSQLWWEDSREKHDYDLSGYRFLVVLGEDFDYHETVVVKQFWEEWGAKVDIAGTDLELTGHLWKKKEMGWD